MGLVMKKKESALSDDFRKQIEETTRSDTVVPEVVVKKDSRKKRIRKGTSERTDGKVTVTLSPSEEDWNKWKIYCEKDGRTLNKGIIHIVNAWIEEHPL